MIKFHRILTKPNLPSAKIHTCTFLQEKYLNVNRQVKVLGKLFGERKSGSKKRWYPSEQGATLPFNIAKSKKLSKTSSRRVTVLSKLFMRHITDLLATGEASEEIVGKGLEISKVKVHQDFHGINVFWVAKGDENDDKIEEILKRCSGPLRHELSQLRLMGEVPKITFVKDKYYSNIAEVENMLKKCDFGDDHIKADNNSIFYDFAGYAENEMLKNDEEEEEPLPLMRQDVFGLDHSRIMDRILGKMKKSKQAWERHELGLNAPDLVDASEDEPTQSSATEDLQKKLEESQSKEEAFQKALKQQRIAWSTAAQRRRYEFHEEYVNEHIEDDSTHWREKDEDDYIEEDEKYK